ncbi:MAG: DUF86 domain-containing protein [Rhodothermales bacterium]|nr:DUF86 domain-containing protein [Rhodothermales bacterium]
MANKMMQDATVRNLEIIGDAVKNLPPNLRATYPDIPWSRIAGLRDVLIHDYFGVNLDSVWNVIENRLPELKQHVLDILSTHPFDSPDQAN